jgi:hypothetical protein
VLEIMYAHILSYLKMLKHLLDYGHQSTSSHARVSKIENSNIYLKDWEIVHIVYIYILRVNFLSGGKLKL